MTAPQTNTDRLAALVAAKLQVVEILLRLSQRQRELIERDEMQGLVRLLAAKQSVLQQMQSLDRQLDPFRGEDPEQRVWRCATDRAACQAQAERCNALIAEAMELEKQAEAAMLARRDAAATVLAAAQTAADARFAYAPLATTSPARLHVEG